MADSPFTRRENFPPTRWSLILRVTTPNPAARREALEDFCQVYWFPLYSYARRRGKSVHDAEDAIQGFLAQLLDRADAFEKLDAEKGKLRSWLLTSLQNFMSDEWDKSQAAKRGGSSEVLSFDIEGAEDRLANLVANPHDDAETVFDKHWAETVLGLARQKLKVAHEAAGKLKDFTVLSPFLTKGTPEKSTENAAAELGKSPGAIRMSVSRLRDDYREAIRREITDTMGIEVDVEEEIKYLISCL